MSPPASAALAAGRDSPKLVAARSPSPAADEEEQGRSSRGGSDGDDDDDEEDNGGDASAALKQALAPTVVAAAPAGDADEEPATPLQQQQAPRRTQPVAFDAQQRSCSAKEGDSDDDNDDSPAAGERRVIAKLVAELADMREELEAARTRLRRARQREQAHREAERVNARVQLGAAREAAQMILSRGAEPITWAEFEAAAAAGVPAPLRELPTLQAFATCQIGKGGFGVVAGYETVDGRFYAVKTTSEPIAGVLNEAAITEFACAAAPAAVLPGSFAALAYVPPDEAGAAAFVKAAARAAAFRSAVAVARAALRLDANAGVGAGAGGRPQSPPPPPLSLALAGEAAAAAAKELELCGYGDGAPTTLDDLLAGFAAARARVVESQARWHRQVVLVTPAAAGSLDALMSRDGVHAGKGGLCTAPAGAAVLLEWLADSAQCLEQLNGCGVAHKDVKAPNMLALPVGGSIRWVMSDMGIACAAAVSLRLGGAALKPAACATRGCCMSYSPPDVNAAFAEDSTGVGAHVLTMLTGEARPFDGVYPEAHLVGCVLARHCGLGDHSAALEAAVLDILAPLIESSFNPDPSMRPDMALWVRALRAAAAEARALMDAAERGVYEACQAAVANAAAATAEPRAHAAALAAARRARSPPPGTSRLPAVLYRFLLGAGRQAPAVDDAQVETLEAALRALGGGAGGGRGGGWSGGGRAPMAARAAAADRILAWRARAEHEEATSCLAEGEALLARFANEYDERNAAARLQAEGADRTGEQQQQQEEQQQEEQQAAASDPVEAEEGLGDSGPPAGPGSSGAAVAAMAQQQEHEQQQEQQGPWQWPQQEQQQQQQQAGHGLWDGVLPFGNVLQQPQQQEQQQPAQWHPMMGALPMMGGAQAAPAPLEQAAWALPSLGLRLNGLGPAAAAAAPAAAAQQPQGGVEAAGFWGHGPNGLFGGLRF